MHGQDALLPQSLLDFHEIQRRTHLWYDEGFDIVKCPGCSHIYLYFYNNGFIYVEPTLAPEKGLEEPNEGPYDIICVDCLDVVALPVLAATHPSLQEIMSSLWSELLDKNKMGQNGLL